uniref:GRF-type domain-containing protein n=1 Tax=Chenopodium quinoa TaxID=63459 RepID=A0A803LAK3_CHEQI
MSSSSSSPSYATNLTCAHGVHSRIATVRRGPNIGKRFYSCPFWKDRSKDCRFFKWEDDLPTTLIGAQEQIIMLQRDNDTLTKENEELISELQRLDKQEAVMITASLIAAAAFQAGVNPPGGIYQETIDDHEREKYKFFKGMFMVSIWMAIVAIAASYVSSVITLAPPLEKDKIVVFSYVVLVIAVLLWILIILWYAGFGPRIVGIIHQRRASKKGPVTRSGSLLGGATGGTGRV